MNPINELKAIQHPGILAIAIRSGAKKSPKEAVKTVVDAATDNYNAAERTVGTQLLGKTLLYALKHRL